MSPFWQVVRKCISLQIDTILLSSTMTNSFTFLLRRCRRYKKCIKQNGVAHRYRCRLKTLAHGCQRSEITFWIAIIGGTPTLTFRSIVWVRNKAVYMAAKVARRVSASKSHNFNKRYKFFFFFFLTDKNIKWTFYGDRLERWIIRKFWRNFSQVAILVQW